MSHRKLYRGLIEAGIDVFWSVYEKNRGRILALEGATLGAPIVAETYPRQVIRCRWRDLSKRSDIPSKRKHPADYIDAVWSRIRAEGYRCDSVVRPTVDQVDAMLCAMAAAACIDDDPSSVILHGEPPVVDQRARILREGYIVTPSTYEGTDS